MSVDPAIRDHQAWLGYLQPDGLVVSPAALVDSQVMLPQDTLQLQQRFVAFVGETTADAEGDAVATIADFPAFACEFLEWPDDCLIGKAERPIPDALNVALPGLGETLSPTFAFRDVKPKDPANPWLFLGQALEVETDMDAVQTVNAAGWSASPSRRFERLLRESQVPIGILTNGTHIRLMYAPRGENAGSLTFPVAAMMEVAGRPILAAFDLLLNRYRLLAAPSEARLPALLAKSREYQSRVSAALAQQVLDALYELLRGFQAANDGMKGELLREVLAKDPDSVYSALVNVLLRLVFLLYAEDRGLMPGSSLYVGNYAVHGLFERLREDAERYPDTMDHRFGAWAQLLAVFRVVYDGCKHPQLAVPARKGYLFDPQRFPFLEGTNEGKDLPLMADGVIYRVLRKLLLLEGERLSYRTLDVEEIGSVYQTIMGFGVEIAGGTTIALKGKRKHGGVPAAPAINLDTLLALTPSERIKWLKERADTDVTGEAAKRLKSAGSMDDLLAALDKRIDRGATPAPVSKGGLVLQPTDERRRTGSHYTPRSFTEPIVRKTLEPILNRLGRHPKPEEILALKVCDIAVGSGAFLVETCRQLADELISSWHYHHQVPVIPPDEDEILFARRLVAQRCLYGVDRNAMAVDLAKLSLWLATLAKDHPFTFLDHAIRCGDSLVGLTRIQLADFHWRPEPRRALGQDVIERRIQAATAYRKEILEADDFVSPELKSQKLALADEALGLVRLAGDCVIAAFFAAGKDRARNEKRNELLQNFVAYLERLDPAADEAVAALRSGALPVLPFHWEIEFPEVFDRDNAGFDAIVGNPPFLGGTGISETAGMNYFKWLVNQYPPCEHHCDLVAYFFRRAFDLMRRAGCFGLIATKTIAQGDTREGGLRTILQSGGSIYAAKPRYKWPGVAAVTVSTVHISKITEVRPVLLEEKEVSRISAYLFQGITDESPVRLKANPYFSIGSKIYGQGFLFDDTDLACTPLPARDRLLEQHPDWQRRIPPYIGGEEINSDPRQQFNRYVICLNDIATEQELGRWPELSQIVKEKVKPERDILGNNPNNIPLKNRWWAFQAHRPELYERMASMDRVLVSSQVSAHFAFVMLPTKWIYSHTVNVFCIDSFGGFALIQSRPHEVWSRVFASSLEDRLRYTQSDCFETYPFPVGVEMDVALEAAGREYYEFRAALMVRNNEGLTKTYNHFHDPDENAPDILRLRALHAAMDAAVLTTYGWTDLLPKCTCEFLLDYEEDETESSAEESTGRKKKKPWRYRWPDEVRDEVLARLLKLNAERAEEERLAGVAAAATELPKKRGRRKSGAATAGGGLFDDL